MLSFHIWILVLLTLDWLNRMLLNFFSANFFSWGRSRNTFESFTFSYWVVFDCFYTFLSVNRWIFFFVFRVLVKSLVDFSLLVRIYIWIKKSIRPKHIFFLSIIFQNNAHLLNFVVFLSVKLQLILKELLGCPCIFVIRIDLRFESTFFHLILLHFLF